MPNSHWHGVASYVSPSYPSFCEAKKQSGAGAVPYREERSQSAFYRPVLRRVVHLRTLYAT